MSENEELNEETHLLQKGNVQDESVELSQLSQKVLEDLEINPKSLNASQVKALNKIVKVEKSFWNSFIWSNLSILLHKIFFAATTNKSAVNNEKGRECNPLWPYGGPVSLKNSAAVQKNAVFKALGSSIEEGVSDSLETIFVSLMGYQIYELIRYGKASLNLVDILKFYFNDTDTVSSLAVIKALHEHPSLFSVLAVPVAYVIAKTLWSAAQSSGSAKKTLAKRIEDLKNLG